MAETYTLDAQSRTVTGKKVGQLRAQGIVPGVVYGAKVQPIHVQFPYRSLELTLLKAGGTHLIDINLDGAVQTVLARNVQRDFIKGTILHVDFYAIDKSVKISTEVPLRFVGEVTGVAAKSGVVQHDMNTVIIEALPTDLIDHLDVDISALTGIGSVIHIRDLVLPAGVAVTEDPDAAVVRLAAPRIVSEEEETGEEEAVSAEPEVIERGKKEEEEGE